MIELLEEQVRDEIYKAAKEVEYKVKEYKSLTVVLLMPRKS